VHTAYTAGHQHEQEVKPGQMQAPDFTTSAFRLSMTLRRSCCGKDELQSTAGETTISLSLATTQERQHHCN